MSEQITIIKPKPRWQFINLKEIYQYRELFWTFVVRDIKIRYKQTIIGGLWAILQPFATMVVFSIFFGVVAKISSEGMPYPIFSYSGLLLWAYFTSALSSASNSLVSSSNLITKVYFPRIIIPLAATLTGMIDYAIASLVLGGLMAYYHIIPTATILLLPFLLILTWLLASGMGFWLSAINVKYRDVRYAVPFFIQLMLFLTPVIYPVSIAPRFRQWLILNPMTGIIEAHRAAILGNNLINMEFLGYSIIITLAIFISGAFYFKSVEKYFADII